MKFGLGLAVQHRPDDDQAARFREHVEQVRLARSVGFSTVWASQHVLAQASRSSGRFPRWPVSPPKPTA